MPTNDPLLGPLEEIVLRAVAHLSTRGYGVTIHDAVENAVRHRVSFGAVYATLDRLERKGYATSTLGEPTPERGGRAKRFYKIEGAGEMALARVDAMRTHFALGLEPGL